MKNRFYLLLAEGGRVLFRYDRAVSNDVPDEAVAVSKSVFDQTLTKQQGEPWVLPDDTVEFRPADGLTLGERQERTERAWRDAQMESVKWLRDRHRDEQELGLSLSLTDNQSRELLVYIQALRDWPQSPVFPEEASRPKAPEWVAEQTE